MADDNKLSGDFNARRSMGAEFDKAVSNGDAEKLRALIGELKLPKDQRTHFLTAQLRAACMQASHGKANIEVIDTLIDAGAKMNQPQAHEVSAFGIVCQSDDVELLRHMIARGGDVNGDVNHDQFGPAKPLHIACDYSQSAEMVQELLDNRANPNAKGFFGQTPLHVLAAARPRRENDRAGVADALVRHGAKVNAVDKWEQTPLLSLIAHSPDGRIAEKLIDAGADLKHTSRNDGSALHMAAERGLHEIVELLIARGAPLLLKNAEGRTPREHAERQKAAANDNAEADAGRARAISLLEEAEKQVSPRHVRKFVRHKWGI